MGLATPLFADSVLSDRQMRKTPHSGGVFRCAGRTGTVSFSRGGHDVGGLRTLRTLLDVKGYGLPLGQRLEAAALDRGEVHEHIRTAIRGRYEPETFGIIEPLYGTCSHFLLPFLKTKCLINCKSHRESMQEIPQRDF